MNKLTKKRFVISKSLIGQNVEITFTNKKEETFTYNHDEVFSNNMEIIQIVTKFQSGHYKLTTIYTLGVE